MAIFTFDASHSLGKVRAVDTRRVNIQVNSDEDLRKARVGQLVALDLPGAIEEWLIGIIGKVIKTPVLEEEYTDEDQDENVALLPRESVLNTVQVTLVGTISLNYGDKIKFSRSLVQVPEIDGLCYILRDAQLQKFMNLLSSENDSGHSLEIGKYTIDESAKTFLDGNKLFQRHASLLGSTGSGKSWTVAAILEQAAKLPSSNLIVFDLHGEYRNLSYAKHLRIPGPEELGKTDDALLFLPFWLFNAEELQALFIDRSEFSAHNQVMAFQDIVVDEKKKTLETLNKSEIIAAFTLDSPIPFNIDNVISELDRLNKDRVPSTSKSGGDKAGPFNGQFDRLILRLKSKISDKRYGFLFQAPLSEHQYDSMANMVKNLMDYSTKQSQIKIIDFSEVPADILPVIVGLVARVIYQVQFWTDYANRRPMAFVCDEAHLYLPKKEGKNPVEQRAIENFEKIAKEGRKYGVALLVVSQRPSDVSTTILSQCNNIIALRLTNSDDQATVKRLMPESLEGLMDALPVLDIGEALVVGDAVLLPSRIRIHPPIEKP
ncbi:MAG: ATP-binding protein, partial [Holosporales bacterium]|nr:ATP-binding protein [Holosporales bacterium]